MLIIVTHHYRSASHAHVYAGVLQKVQHATSHPIYWLPHQPESRYNLDDHGYHPVLSFMDMTFSE